jgi:hypothetical protein
MGQDSGLADVIAKEELQLSDFEITDDDEDLFAVKEPIKDNYMDAWWGKFLDSKHHAKIPNKDDEVYHDSEDLVSLDGSSDEGTCRKKKRKEGIVSSTRDITCEYQLC